MAIFIDAFLFDESNEEKFAGHGVSTIEVREVLDGPYRTFTNKGTGSAPYVMVGPTSAGRFLLVPVAPVDADDGVWRSVTAFDAPAFWLARCTQAVS
jgi:hypothetical protein